MENLGLNIDIDTAITVDGAPQVQQEQTLEELKEERKPQMDNVASMASSSETVPTNVTATDNPGTQVIGKIKSSLFGGFTKILSFLAQGTGSQDIIYIREGKLNLVKNAGFIYCDLSIMFEEHDLELVDPSKSIKLLNLIRGGDEVLFLKDDLNSRYLISNLIGEDVSTTITLPQPDQAFTNDISKPDLGELKSTTVLEIDTVDNIQNAAKTLEAQFLKLELENDTNEIISISTSDDIFKQDFKRSENTTIFKVFNPFPISKPDELFFEIHQNGEQKWIKTISNTGMVSIEYMELIESVGEFDSFAL